jgi:hypothetical protein
VDPNGGFLLQQVVEDRQGLLPEAGERERQLWSKSWVLE